MSSEQMRIDSVATGEKSRREILGYLAVALFMDTSRALLPGTPAQAQQLTPEQLEEYFKKRRKTAEERQRQDAPPVDGDPIPTEPLENNPPMEITLEDAEKLATRIQDEMVSIFDNKYNPDSFASPEALLDTFITTEISNAFMLVIDAVISKFTPKYGTAAFENDMWGEFLTEGNMFDIASFITARSIKEEVKWNGLSIFVDEMVRTLELPAWENIRQLLYAIWFAVKHNSTIDPSTGGVNWTASLTFPQFMRGMLFYHFAVKNGLMHSSLSHFIINFQHGIIPIALQKISK